MNSYVLAFMFSLVFVATPQNFYAEEYAKNTIVEEYTTLEKALEPHIVKIHSSTITESKYADKKGKILITIDGIKFELNYCFDYQYQFWGDSILEGTIRIKKPGADKDFYTEPVKIVKKQNITPSAIKREFKDVIAEAEYRFKKLEKKRQEAEQEKKKKKQDSALWKTLIKGSQPSESVRPPQQEELETKSNDSQQIKQQIQSKENDKRPEEKEEELVEQKNIPTKQDFEKAASSCNEIENKNNMLNKSIAYLHNKSIEYLHTAVTLFLKQKQETLTHEASFAAYADHENWE